MHFSQVPELGMIILAQEWSDDKHSSWDVGYRERVEAWDNMVLWVVLERAAGEVLKDLVFLCAVSIVWRWK
jgi:hypothetical protein